MSDDGLMTKAAVVTPSDSTNLIANGDAPRALYIGVSGDVALLMSDGSGPFTFKAVPVGILRVRAAKVMSTNTTATNILALF